MSTSGAEVFGIYFKVSLRSDIKMTMSQLLHFKKFKKNKNFLYFLSEFNQKCFQVFYKLKETSMPLFI